MSQESINQTIKQSNYECNRITIENFQHIQTLQPLLSQVKHLAIVQ